jgi:hypothetical protein
MHGAMVKTVRFLQYGADTPETLTFWQLSKIAPNSRSFQYINTVNTQLLAQGKRYEHVWRHLK